MILTINAFIELLKKTLIEFESKDLNKKITGNYQFYNELIYFKP